MAKKPSQDTKSKTLNSTKEKKTENDSFLYLLHQGYLTYRDLLSDNASHYGMTPTTAMVLGLIDRYDSISAAQLAKRLRVTPQSINTHILTLESIGHIEREKLKGDKRAFKLTVTKKGKTILTQSRQDFEETEMAALSFMNKEMREELKSNLSKVIASVRKYHKELREKQEEKLLGFEI